MIPIILSWNLREKIAVQKILQQEFLCGKVKPSGFDKSKVDYVNIMYLLIVFFSNDWGK